MSWRRYWQDMTTADVAAADTRRLIALLPVAALVLALRAAALVVVAQVRRMTG